MKKWFVIPALTLAFTSAKAQNVTNYTFSAVSGAYTQLQGTAGSASPALSGGTLDDGWFNSIPVGFLFTYEGVSYSTVAASTNGWLYFGSTLSSSAFTNNLNTGSPRPMLAPLWDDLQMNAAGGLTYYTTGTAPSRVFTIEWLNMKWNYLQAAAGITFQVKLYEDTKRIEFIYRQDAGAIATCSASIGLGGATSGVYLSLNGTGASPAASSVTETNTLNAKPATGQIYRFDPYTIKPVVTSMTPVLGPLGTTVTINGSGFDPNANGNFVWFGAVKATVVSATTSQLTVTVPTGTSFRDITVTTNASNLTSASPSRFDVTFPCGGAINSSSFEPKVDFSPYASALVACGAIGDVDGDGKPEVIAGWNYNAANKGVSVYRNISTPGTLNSSSLAPKVNFSAYDTPFDMMLGDVDGDGKPDLVVADYSSMVCIYRNTSTTGVINASTFAARVDVATGIAGTPRGVRLRDLDNDGKPEIVIAGWNGYVSVFKNSCSVGVISAASFTRTDFAAGSSPYDVAIGDIDGDGKPDMAVSNNGGTTVSVYRNTSVTGTINASSFTSPVNFTASAGPFGIDLVDMDGDGKLDIVTACIQAGVVDVLRNTATSGVINASSFAAHVSFTTGTHPYRVTVADFDGDGKPDFATQNNVSNTMSVFRNTSTSGVINSSSFAAKVDFTTPNTPYYITSGDIDLDGKADIMVPCYNWSGGYFSLYHNVVSPYIQIAPSTVLGSVSYCDDGTWKTFYDASSPTNALVAIKSNSNALGTITVNEYEDGSVGTYNAVYFLARHFKITPQFQPSSAVQVRLYITAAELSALEAADGSVTSLSSLNVTKYQGPTEDGTYYPNDATSLVAIPPASITTGVALNGYYLEFSVTSFSEFWIHGWSGVLPIHLLDFNAAADNDHVNLDWSTATETDNHYFTVEKTQDGNNFEVVDVIAGAGTSTSQSDYSTIDPNPYPGTSYYRLKQTDFNGQSTYSELRPVTFDGSSQLFSVYPNPANGVFHLKCPADGDAVFMLEIFDISGKLVMSKTGAATDLDRESLELPDGVYSVVLSNGTMKYHQPLIVTR